MLFALPQTKQIFGDASERGESQFQHDSAFDDEGEDDEDEDDAEFEDDDCDVAEGDERSWGQSSPSFACDLSSLCETEFEFLDSIEVGFSELTAILVLAVCADELDEPPT